MLMLVGVAGVCAMISGHRGGDVELIGLPGEGARTCEQRPLSSGCHPTGRSCSLLPCSPNGYLPVAFSWPRCDVVRFVLLVDTGEVDEQSVACRNSWPDLQAELLVQVLRGKGVGEEREVKRRGGRGKK